MIFQILGFISISASRVIARKFNLVSYALPNRVNGIPNLPLTGILISQINFGIDYV